MNDKFCVLPFIHFELNTKGEYRPCCLYDIPNNEKVYDIHSSSLTDIRNGDWLKDIQSRMLDGTGSAGCYKCYNDDKLGNTSRRTRENKRFSDEIENINNGIYNLRIVDLKPGNTCNLKCRICNEDSSSAWYSEKQSHNSPDIKNKNIEQFKWYKIEDVWNNLSELSETLTHVEIFGGEPFLMKQHMIFLNRLVELGYSSNVSVTYATNGTIWPDEKFRNLLANFKSVNFMISADGIEDTFEYARNPAVWSEFEENLRKYVNEKHSITVAYSVSSFSIYNLPEALHFYHDNNIPVWLNTVYDKTRITIFPPEVKQAMTKHLVDNYDSKFDEILHEKSYQSYIDYMNSADDSNLWSTFVEKNKLFDKYRNEDLVSIVPILKGFY